ncbi:ParB/RepB/Spo0J family partition protein [Streptomyces subrutilus]|uniref:ParB/RepB/Spo0J family partition protein n=1 Tax=Streptomyces subrutilus TaxID=36818 RepID=UPI003407BE1B
MNASERVTRGFSIDEDGLDTQPAPRRIRTRQQIIAGEGKRPPAAVALSALAHNPFNPRDELTEIEETAASLRERGQIQPVAVVRTAAFLAIHADQAEQIGEAEYVVIDGNRRLAAAHAAGLAALRIDVNDALASSAADILESALIANVHRVDVPPIDQAKAISELVSVHGTQGVVAKRLGKTEAWVSQRLALLKLPQDLQEKVESGELRVRDGRRIGRLPADQQHAEAEKALNPVKAPRKARTRGGPAGSTAVATAPDTEINHSSPPALVPVQGGGHDGPTVDQALNPVKTATAETSTPHLQWDSPQRVAEQLRTHMTAEHREELVTILMADLT